MKSKTIFTFTCLILTILVLNSQFTGPSVSSTADTPSYSGLSTNRVIMNPSNLTFIRNNNISIFMLVENIGNLIVRDLNFNYTVDTSLFAIIQSSNITQSSNKTVYFNYKDLNPGESFSFNMTLRVLSNKTKDNIVLPGVVINYKYSEFLLPGTTTTNSLTVNIQQVKTTNTLVQKIVGKTELNSYALAGILALPIIIGFILSFIFGRRQRRL